MYGFFPGAARLIINSYLAATSRLCGGKIKSAVGLCYFFESGGAVQGRKKVFVGGYLTCSSTSRVFNLSWQNYERNQRRLVSREWNVGGRREQPRALYYSVIIKGCFVFFPIHFPGWRNKIISIFSTTRDFFIFIILLIRTRPDHWIKSLFEGKEQKIHVVIHVHITDYYLENI